ncbi:MAG TPA: nuclear transport factor 2 family protein [Acidimicrobiales bacterium]|nr:nuclear transport factor 2 family protein [Acidimicrobiales bacterium]
MNDSELGNIADRLFRAFEKHDAKTLRELCAPHARFWSSATKRESDIEELIEALPGMKAAIGKHRYEEVRRMVAPDGFVEQHRVRATRPDGKDVDIEACVVVRVDEDDRIVRLDEYLSH